MPIKFTKYFSLFIILFLINSNYSFAVTQMMCKMSSMQNECKCGNDSETKGMQINTKDSECCKIKISEINNSNTLEKNNNSFVNKIIVQSVSYFIPPVLTSNSYLQRKSYTHFKKPFSDIPVLFSTLLI